jgi:hypothetical protein
MLLVGSWSPLFRELTAGRCNCPIPAGGPSEARAPGGMSEHGNAILAPSDAVKALQVYQAGGQKCPDVGDDQLIVQVRVRSRGSTFKVMAVTFQLKVRHFLLRYLRDSGNLFPVHCPCLHCLVFFKRMALHWLEPSGSDYHR